MKKSALAILSVVPWLASTTLLAQGRPESSGTASVRVFKGSGSDRVANENRPPSRPPRGLNPSDFTDIVKVLGKVEPGSGYVSLSPSHPLVQNKGALVFWDANLVETGENYVYWGEPSLKHGVRGGVALWLWTPASRQYLIDCSLSGYEYPANSESGRTGPSFNVVGPAGDTQVFYFNNNVVSGPSSYSAFDLFKSENAGVHLVFALTAATKGWYGFQITPHGVHGPGAAQWAFFSCDVKNV